ncbi:MAG: tyrosine-type recombinase/integrase, partial [Xanthobacteraceae bacterium]
VADNQKQAQEFATHLNDYKALREDLDHLEGMHRTALDRLEKLQASERERAPQAELLEAAAPSQEPWRPNYRLDAAISLVGSFAFGVFAAWFAEFIVGPTSLPTAFVEHSWAPALLAREPAGPLRELGAPNIAQLPAPIPPSRELTDAEITALIAAATDDPRMVIVALLMGVRAEELAALRWDEIDPNAGLIRVSGESARTIPLQEPLRSLIVARQSRRVETAPTVLHDVHGRPLSIEEIGELVLYSAYDAGIDRPHEVTADALRYTYLGFLLRQGIRAADIGRIVGRIPQNELIAYMQLHSPTARLPFEQIERLLPVLRELDVSRTG